MAPTLQKAVNSLTIAIISIIFMLCAGIFLYLHESEELENKFPLYFAAGIILASWGANILFHMLIKNVLPCELYEEINSIKK
jgi:hypothetical protein